MAQQPSVAIVIPAYNEERFIGKCLESCIDQTSTPDEIIVVNNRSTDGTASIVRRYQEANPDIEIRLIDQNEYQGIAPTRNCGFDYAQSDVISRTDADSIVANDWVERIRHRFADPDIDASSGPIVFYDMPFRSFLFWLDSLLRDKVQNKAKNERFLIGANMAIRAQAWKSVRELTQLDLEDRLHEDVDLALTLFKNDFEIVYDGRMVAGMSARRVESSLPDFWRYVTRYTRTTDLHGIKSPAAWTSIITLMVLYYPFRTMRFFYDLDNLQFTFVKLRAKLRAMSAPRYHRKPLAELVTG
jgi:glycosyltransferase involved in cell wall biosynthesis